MYWDMIAALTGRLSDNDPQLLRERVMKLIHITAPTPYTARQYAALYALRNFVPRRRSEDIFFNIGARPIMSVYTTYEKAVASGLFGKWAENELISVEIGDVERQKALRLLALQDTRNPRWIWDRLEKDRFKLKPGSGARDEVLGFSLGHMQYRVLVHCRRKIFNLLMDSGDPNRTLAKFEPTTQRRTVLYYGGETQWLVWELGLRAVVDRTHPIFQHMQSEVAGMRPVVWFRLQCDTRRTLLTSFNGMKTGGKTGNHCGR